MIREKRIKKIEEYVIKNESASLEELARKFNVSINTIRRDIQELVERGNFKKVYGGIAVIHEQLKTFQDRTVHNKEEKIVIGKLAAEFVREDDIIFIDSGTTTIEMFEFIKDKQLTIITNNIEFINRAIPYPNLSIISIGGTLIRETQSFGYDYNNEFLKPFNINKAFMASTGISIANGITNASPFETRLKNTIVNKSLETYLLVDHTKFDRHGLMTYCELDQIDYLITDKTPPKTYINFFGINNIKLITPEE